MGGGRPLGKGQQQQQQYHQELCRERAEEWGEEPEPPAGVGLSWRGGEAAESAPALPAFVRAEESRAEQSRRAGLSAAQRSSAQQPVSGGRPALNEQHPHRAGWPARSARGGSGRTPGLPQVGMDGCMAGAVRAEKDRRDGWGRHCRVPSGVVLDKGRAQGLRSQGDPMSSFSRTRVNLCFPGHVPFCGTCPRVTPCPLFPGHIFFF